MMIAFDIKTPQAVYLIMRSIFIEPQGLADGRLADHADHHAQGKQADGNQYSQGKAQRRRDDDLNTRHALADKESSAGRITASAAGGDTGKDQGRDDEIGEHIAE